MRVIEFQKVVLSSNAEPIISIVKLMDACNECAHLFSVASKKVTNENFSQVAGGINRQLEQYAFELQTEIHRLGGPSRFSAISAEEGEADTWPLRCEVGLQLALNNYQKALDAQLTAHARAMLKRQLSALQQAYEQLAALHKAA